MLQAAFAVAVTTILCLFFDTTRWAGILGILLLVYLHPAIASAVIALFVALYFGIHLFNEWKDEGEAKKLLR